MVERRSTAKLEARLLRRAADLTIVHHVDEAGVVASRGREVLTLRSQTSSISTHGKFPAGYPRDLFGWSRITERFARADMCCIYRTSTGLMLGVRRGVVYHIETGSYRSLFEVQGDCPLHNSIAEAVSGNLYFGDYFRNPERGAVYLYRVSPDLASHAVAHRFDRGQIRHIHGVYRDPFIASRLWVTVGDNDGENHIYFTDDEFATLDRIGDGSQMFRAVGLLFFANHIAWGTDSPSMPNRMVTMDRKTEQIEQHQPMPSPVWYATQTTDGVFLATSSVEHGAAATADAAKVWASRDARIWSEILSFTKDRWPMPYFKWGTIALPSGRFASDNVWISGEGVNGLDGCSINFAVV